MADMLIQVMEIITDLIYLALPFLDLITLLVLALAV